MSGKVPSISIVELGSQYTLPIERQCRELGRRATLFEPERAGKWMAQFPPKLIILSGGQHGVHDEGAPEPPDGVLEMRRSDGRECLKLCICYGHQWVAKMLGGEVRSIEAKRNYGKTMITVLAPEHPLFRGTPVRQQVWMNHGDSITTVPAGFVVLAVTDSGTIAAMARGNIWTTQFHPEVQHTVYGKHMMQNVLETAECERDWVPTSLIDDIQRSVLESLKSDDVVLGGMSGGVDSTTAAAILYPVLAGRFKGLTVNGGQLRRNEIDEVRANVALTGLPLHVHDAHKEMNMLMADTTDAVLKRLRFQYGYTMPFIMYGKGNGATHVLQGTLAPDLIESGKTGGSEIKGHHNVGNDWQGMIKVEPFHNLFKYEVRALAREMGLPEHVWARQPFPGPGLLIRTLAIPAINENVAVTCWCDEQVTGVLKKHGLYDTLDQSPVAFAGLPLTTGVKGDKRTYQGTCLVRAVKTNDFMTADGVHFSDEVEDDIQRAVTVHPRIARVFFDVSDKPPGTIEWE